MQAVFVNIVTLGLLVFLFGAAARLRPNKQVRLWVAAWLFVMAHFCFELWSPNSLFWEHLQESLSFNALVLAGICFVLSNIIIHETTQETKRIGVWLISTNLLCTNLILFGPPPLGILYVLVIVQHIGGLAGCWKNLRDRAPILYSLSAIQILGLVWMLAALQLHQPEILIPAILSELFLCTAFDIWFSRGQRWKLGLCTTTIGLIAWGLVFPLALFAGHFWPSLSIDPETWNVPKFCTAIGMMLIVLEEEIAAVRTLADEYGLLFQNSPNPLWIFDIQTLEILNVNRAALEKHQYTREEFLSLKLIDLIDPPLIPHVLQMIASPIRKSNHVSRHIRKDGSILPLEVTSRDLIFQGRKCRFVLGIDITERELLNQQLIHQARHDVLTGLPNRMLFREQLSEAVEQTVREGGKLAIICLDLYHFKRINDTYGTNVGDECLKQVASLLNAKAGSEDIVARTAGEEFTIVLPGLKNVLVAETLVTDLKELFTKPLLIEEQKVYVSFSIGIAICPDDGISVAHLWRGAENAMCQAQELGSGQVVWLSPELSSASEEEIELEAYMRIQLEEDGFHLAYQPLFTFDGKVRGLEALLRLNHPRYGTVSPAKFIPIAEKTGLIVPIGEWVIEEVCRQIQEWQDQGMQPVPVAINVSGIQLTNSNFAQRMLCILQRHQISPHLIELEVTESVVMFNMVEVSRQMRILSSNCIRFSIDDFGTGHSSLGRLDQLPISTLKIDRSFTERLGSHDGTYSIVQAIISMAKSLGLEVVAEGVDRDEQIAKLRELQCDYMQGFLLSRPLKPQAVPTVVEQTSHLSL